MRAAILILSALLLQASAAQAQFFARPKPAGPPPGTPAIDAEIWPFPPPDPESWWTEKRPRPSEAADPLSGRRLPRGRRLPAIDNGVDPATYRLWGLPPLQWQVLHGDEAIIEVWARPSRSVRQSLVRITLRDDGRAFVQGRAGFACCEAEIGRRIGFDAQLPAGAAQGFQALRDSAAWTTPHDVQAAQDGAVSDVVCIQGVGYDLTLVTAAGTRSLHRECDDVAVGQVADILEPVLRAALGQDPRFDVIFRGAVDFGPDRRAYQAFIAGGGVLKPDPHARARRPGAEPAPQPETP